MKLMVVVATSSVREQESLLSWGSNQDAGWSLVTGHCQLQ